MGVFSTMPHTVQLLLNTSRTSMNISSSNDSSKQTFRGRSDVRLLSHATHVAATAEQQLHVW
jgi:competence protein ComGF